MDNELLKKRFINVILKKDIDENEFKKELLNEIHVNKYSLHELDGVKCKTVNDLYKEFAYKFKFPDYFGYNWPAFDECLNDLEWINSTGYVLLINNADFVLSKDKKELKTLIKLLIIAVNDWNYGRKANTAPITIPTPFYIFFMCYNKDSEIVNYLSTLTI